MSDTPNARRGLPGQVKMRHDQHFVDNLTTQSAPAVGRLLALSAIRPDPGQPRTSMGDLSELVASIRDKGVLEPILVRPSVDPSAEADFLIISGERRFRAALEVGLYEIPAIEMDVSREEALEIALVENLQRQDLTPFEEAAGYEALADLHAYSHEKIAAAVGKSRTAITETLTLLKMPTAVRECVAALGIRSKSALLEVAKLDDEAEMLALLERISTRGLNREAIRREVKRRRQGGRGGRRKPYSFRFSSPDKRYRLSLSFRQSTVEPEDLISALEETLRQIKEELRSDEDRL